MTLSLFDRRPPRRRRPPIVRASFDAELVVDNFAGGGGASTGIEAAIGRPVDIAINHDAEAIAMHEANHPETRHFTEDVWNVDPVEACGGRPVGLAWFSPDCCFPAGTMVLTQHGYAPIENLCVGDLVLTHRQRWRRVTQTHQSTKPLLEIRGHGHHGLRVSSEHPIYARRRQGRHRGYTLESPQWVPASAMGKGWYWSTPTEVEALPIPELRRRSKKGTGVPIDERLMWLAGRYLGDGWTRLTADRAELVIICGKHEADDLAPMLDVWPRTGPRAQLGELGWQRREVRTAIQFTTNCRALVEWLRGEFGHGAGEKRIPGWALGMDEKLRRALLEGYVSADGWEGNDRRSKALVECTTVSPSLAWGVRSLAATLGLAAAVYKTASQNGVIEGRSVNVRPAYRVRWRRKVEADRAQTHLRDGLRWAPVREARELGDAVPVFNIAVEEDESYVAEGVIVHNCHFSRAKGATPVKKEIRGLAWVVIRWAQAVRPRVIVLENVEEFETWGPVIAGRPCPVRKGETFRYWIAKLTSLGYAVEWRSLVAADYGAPTTRKRLYLIARCDGKPIVWPEPTHGTHGDLPWRTAAECIQWELPCPSIFDRPRPLAEATQRRIAAGIRRYVLDHPSPFLVTLRGTGPSHLHGDPIDAPLRTVSAGGTHHALAAPHLFPVTHHGADRGYPLDEPMRTVTGAHRGEIALASPTLIQTGYGERPGQAPRVPGLEKPLGTAVSGQKHAPVAAFLARHFGGMVGSDLTRPLHTVTAKDHHSLVTATLGERREQVRAFLTTYYGTGIGQAADEPLRTVTSRDRFGLVAIDGVDYAISDIGMRMLQPRELFRAQGFSDSYVIDRGPRGPLTKTVQTRLVGNSVAPPVAEAIVRANYGRRAEVAA